MEPKIIELKEKHLIGISTNMSIANNKTKQLWGNFIPRVKEIKHRVNTDKISLQEYPVDYFQVFNPTKEFTKWATVEVSSFDNIPNGMNSFILKSGIYAVFHYKGSSDDTSIFQYIFSEWIPKSKYRIDNRPHFEVLGKKYVDSNSNSEEEIWIPITLKA